MPLPTPRIDSDPLSDIKRRPLTMGLPVTAERRNWVRRDALMRRITSEFAEMPGLALSIPQASRFLGLPRDACERVLDRLSRDGVLARSPRGLYVRRV